MQAVHIVYIGLSLFLFALVIDFVRRGLLKEKYSVLWLGAIFAVTILAFWNSLIDTVAGLLGVSYAPSLLFLVAFIFVIMILLHFSVVISILTDKNKMLAQELSLLRFALKDSGALADIEGGGGSGGAGDGGRDHLNGHGQGNDYGNGHVGEER